MTISLNNYIVAITQTNRLICHEFGFGRLVSTRNWPCQGRTLNPVNLYTITGLPSGIIKGGGPPENPRT